MLHSMTTRAYHQVATMAVFSVALTAIVVLLLAFADTYALEPARHCAASFAKAKWPLYIGCIMDTHEGLAAGLIGAAGALIAGWLAYSAAQEAAARALAEAREAKSAALSEGVATTALEIDRLKLAKGYLETFAANFPPTHPGASTGGFVTALRQCHAKALDFLSSSAVRAPYGYGAQISTVMTRVEKLGEQIETTLQREVTINPDVVWADVVFEAIAGIRAISSQISNDIPIHEKHFARLADERDKADE